MTARELIKQLKQIPTERLDEEIRLWVRGPNHLRLVEIQDLSDLTDPEDPLTINTVRMKREV